MRRALLLSALTLLTACEQRVSRYDSSLRDDIAGVWVYPREQTGVTTVLFTDGVTWKSYEYAENSISTRKDAKSYDSGEVLGQEGTYFFANKGNFYSPDFLVRTPTGKDIFIRSRSSYDRFKETGRIPYQVIVRVARTLDPQKPPERPSIETLGLPYGR